MKTLEKYIKYILILGFFAYWLLLIILFVFQKQAWTETIRSSKYTFWMMPVNYRMYTSPPRQNLYIYYQYFHGDTLLEQLEVSDYFQSSLKSSKNISSFLNNLYLYRTYPKSSFILITNTHSNYLFNLENGFIYEIAYKDFLDRYKSREFQLINNQFFFAHKLLQEKNFKSNIDSIKIIFELEDFDINKNINWYKSNLTITPERRVVLILSDIESNKF